MSPHTTDFAALGLPDCSPFDILKAIRRPPAQHKIPGKTGPRKQGKSIQLPGSREKQILRVNPERSHSYTQADNDKTKKIAGKPNHRRSQ